MDILCLSETHLKTNDIIDINGFHCFANNRKTSVSSRKGSGGVAILVKNHIFDKFSVNVIDKSFEGIIGVELRHKISSKIIIVYSCYLPPEGSPWADTTSFYGHLICAHYLHIYADFLVFAGDFNARIGNKQDSINYVDNIGNRVNIDNSVNSYCDSFLEFLKDAKLCTVNGRVTPHLDNFTCLKHNGQSVVDYLITEHNVIDNFKVCQVISVSDIINDHNLFEFISKTSRPPDHSIVWSELDLNLTIDTNLIGNFVSSEDNCNNSNVKRVYKFDNVDSNFMNNNTWLYAINEIINTLENNIKRKNNWIMSTITLFLL